MRDGPYEIVYCTGFQRVFHLLWSKLHNAYSEGALYFKTQFLGGIFVVRLSVYIALSSESFS